jgi:hypothetical protein
LFEAMSIKNIIKISVFLSIYGICAAQFEGRTHSIRLP